MEKRAVFDGGKLLVNLSGIWIDHGRFRTANPNHITRIHCVAAESDDIFFIVQY